MPERESIPVDPTTVDATWMHDALTDAGVADGGNVLDVTFGGFIGTGQMARNARFALTWDDPEGRPASVVGKFPSDDLTGRTSGFDGGTYLNEWTFYRELAATVDVRAPRCHVARYDGDGQNFVLLMEDLSDSVQGDQMLGLDVDRAALAVEQAVALHAPRWGDPALLGLVKRTPEETETHLHEVYALTMEGTLARLGPNLDTEVIELVRRLAPKVGRWVASFRDTPLTVVHMDFRPDNFLFGATPAAPPLVVVDWQTYTAGPGTHDVAYMLGGSFEPDERADVERDLVASYGQQLAARGIDRSFDVCWRDYRVSSIWGVIMSVVATMLAAQTERGDVMLTTMLRRHAHHAIDLDALDLVN